MEFLLRVIDSAASLKIPANFTTLIVAFVSKIIIEGNVLKAHA